ncbi:MAG: type III pantothenate kinase, partial [Herbaspirillum sp.]
MLLLIDAGNTQIKWALAPRCSASTSALAPVKLGEWQHSGCCTQADSSQLAAAWHGLEVSHVLIANVAGVDCAVQLRKQLQSAFGDAVQVHWFASQPALAGLQNNYANPFQ